MLFYLKSSYFSQKLTTSLETRLNDFVSLQSCNYNIKDPKADKDSRSDSLDVLRTSQLSTNGGVATDEKNQDGNQGLNAKDSNRKAQAERDKNSLVLNKVSKITMVNTYVDFDGSQSKRLNSDYPNSERIIIAY
jgi:hypothetical protein